MGDLLIPGLILVGIMGVLLGLGMLMNRARVKRLKQRVEEEGAATCRDCGHQGSLSYGLMAGKLATSSNIRLICAKCGSENWFVPGGKRDGKSNRDEGSRTNPKVAT